MTKIARHLERPQRRLEDQRVMTIKLEITTDNISDGVNPVTTMLEGKVMRNSIYLVRLHKDLPGYLSHLMNLIGGSRDQLLQKLAS